MSRTKRTAFPRWVIAATLALCLAVVTLGILATQMFAKEIAIYREQLQRKSWAESKIGPMPNSDAYPIRSTELTASDSDTAPFGVSLCTLSSPSAPSSSSSTRNKTW